MDVRKVLILAVNPKDMAELRGVLPINERRKSDKKSQSRQTILERMGKTPEHWLSMGYLSDRDVRCSLIEKHLQVRRHRRSCRS